MSDVRTGGGLRRVRVELADGFNFVGTVQREYRDSHGRRRIEVEDTRGKVRDVRLNRPSVSVRELGDGGAVGVDCRSRQSTASAESDSPRSRCGGQSAGDESGESLQEQLRAAYRDSVGGGSG